MIWRRKKSLVNPRQQVWFGLELIAVTFGFNILCGFLLFVPPMSEWFGGDESSASALDALTQLILLKWPLICISIGVLFIIGILMSHRLAGPVFGLLKVLNAWKRGDRSARVHFRKYDYLINAMEPLNSVLSLEEKRYENIKKILSEMGQSSDPSVAKKANQALTILNQTEGPLS